LAPVVKTTAAQSVARRILEMIRAGIWQPGDQLPTEKELIEQLAVGRSTVREALQILSTVNVIQATAGHGTFIRTPTAAGVFRPDLIALLIGNSFALELLEAREMIEPPTVRLAALRATDAELDRVGDVLAAHESAHRTGRPVSEYAARFHVMLAEASHNQVASSFMSSILEMLTARGRRFDHIPDYQQRELQEHQAILAAVRAREPERAAELMLRHIVESAATYDTDCANPAERLPATPP
jgi:DNA-binding FadR family transcriptional regulator